MGKKKSSQSSSHSSLICFNVREGLSGGGQRREKTKPEMAKVWFYSLTRSNGRGNRAQRLELKAEDF